MQSSRYYLAEAETIRREMHDIRNDERNKNLRQLLGRVARSYEEIAAEIEAGVRRRQSNDRSTPGRGNELGT